MSEAKAEKKKGYADVAAYYRQKIRSGTMPPGDPMPTLTEAGEEHGVSRNTAVRAYDVLKREGYITARPGAGTVVAAEGMHLSGSDRIARIEKGESGYLPGETKVESTAGMRSVDDIVVAEALGVDLRDEIGVRTRVFLRDGKRTMYAISCYHLRAVSAVPELAEMGDLPGQWQKLYEERTGRSVYKAPQHYGARIATPDEMAKFHLFRDVTAARAVLVVTTQFSDENGPLAYWEDIYAPGLTRPADVSAE